MSTIDSSRSPSPEPASPERRLQLFWSGINQMTDRQIDLWTTEDPTKARRSHIPGGMLQIPYLLAATTQQRIAYLEGLRASPAGGPLPVELVNMRKDVVQLTERARALLKSFSDKHVATEEDSAKYNKIKEDFSLLSGLPFAAKAAQTWVKSLAEKLVIPETTPELDALIASEFSGLMGKVVDLETGKESLAEEAQYQRLQELVEVDLRNVVEGIKIEVPEEFNDICGGLMRKPLVDSKGRMMDESSWTGCVQTTKRNPFDNSSLTSLDGLLDPYKLKPEELEERLSDDDIKLLADLKSFRQEHPDLFQ